MEQQLRQKDQQAHDAAVQAFNKGYSDIITEEGFYLQVKRVSTSSRVSAAIRNKFCCYFEDEHLPVSPVKIFFDESFKDLLAEGLWIDVTAVRGMQKMADTKFGHLVSATFVIEEFDYVLPAVAVMGEDDLDQYNPRKYLEPWEAGVYSNWDRQDRKTGEKKLWHWCPRLYCDTSRFKSQSDIRKFVDSKIKADKVTKAKGATHNLTDIWEADNDSALFYSDFFRSVVNQSLYTQLWEHYVTAITEAYEHAYQKTEAKNTIDLSEVYAKLA